MGRNLSFPPKRIPVIASTIIFPPVFRAVAEMAEFNSANVEEIVANYQPPEAEFNFPETANLDAKSKSGHVSSSFVDAFSAQ